MLADALFHPGIDDRGAGLSEFPSRDLDDGFVMPVKYLSRSSVKPGSDSSFLQPRYRASAMACCLPSSVRSSLEF